MFTEKSATFEFYYYEEKCPLENQENAKIIAKSCNLPKKNSYPISYMGFSFFGFKNDKFLGSLGPYSCITICSGT